MAQRRPKSSAGLVTSIVVAVILASAAAAGFVLSNRSPSGSPGHAAARPPTTPAGPPDRSRGVAPGSVTTPPAQSLATLYRQDAGGVVRVDASTCGGSGVGSGFLIAPTLVATAAHVIDGAVAVALTSGDTTRVGQVVGIDPATDVALIRTTTPLPGHVFELSRSQPAVGLPVGVIGYPETGSVSLLRGSIRGLDRSMRLAGQPHDGLIQTDALIDPGSSGGPLLSQTGAVIGLADASGTAAQGSAYAVPAGVAAPLLSRWSANPAPPPAGSCTHPLGPAELGPVQTSTHGPDLSGISATLTTYFKAIDSGDYARAYAQLGPRARAALSEQQLAGEDASSYDFNLQIRSITPAGAGQDLVDMSFTSLQSSALGPNGDSCDRWALRYTMVQSNGAWSIDGAAGQAGGASTSCPA